MNKIVTAALEAATVGELALEIQKRLRGNTEVKIKKAWVRVQHTQHCDRLSSAADVDHALTLNLIAK